MHGGVVQDVLDYKCFQTSLDNTRRGSVLLSSPEEASPNIILISEKHFYPDEKKPWTN